jgi:hypothetical protein
MVGHLVKATRYSSAFATNRAVVQGSGIPSTIAAKVNAGVCKQRRFAAPAVGHRLRPPKVVLHLTRLTPMGKPARMLPRAAMVSSRARGWVIDLERVRPATGSRRNHRNRW